MKYCPEIEFNLLKYTFMPYKASTSKTIIERFSFGHTGREISQDLVDKINPIIVNHIESVGHQERVAWIGSFDEDLPDQGIQVPNTPT